MRLRRVVPQNGEFVGANLVFALMTPINRIRAITRIAPTRVLPANDTYRRGVQRGEAPLRFFFFPHDWGTKGVDDGDSRRDEYLLDCAIDCLEQPR